MDNYQKFIHLSRYARYVEGEDRRETWSETVNRYVDFFKERYGDRLKSFKWDALRSGIHDLKVMPSMRALMTAGPALARDNTAGYNCSYVAVNNTDVFKEVMHILMCGTGVGFSVENRYVSQLPDVPETLTETGDEIVVADSKEGWATAFGQLIDGLYSGVIHNVNYDLVRPAGTRLRVFGGRASGPAPLRKLFDFTVKVFQERRGLRLRPIDCHDILCMVGDVVVCGGVRRSALISLSDLDDEEMRDAKTGEWWKDNPQRALANNSAVYPGDISREAFEREWAALVASGSGERGIFSRDNASIPNRRERRDFGTNPCSEIVLRDKQFCNLTEIIIRPDDTEVSIAEKVVLATVLGTLQSGLDYFPFLSDEWEKNTKEERLLGVSLTGILDHPFFSKDSRALNSVLEEMSTLALLTNRRMAEELGIEESKAITCVKPSGTVSQLCDTASGIHPRYAPFYVRRVRMDNKDPLANWMIDAGIPYEKDFYGDSNWVFSFPVKAPNSVYRNDRTAIEQLELWKTYQTSWCEHKPSVTIYVAQDEWDVVREWVWANRDCISGVSFLPKEDGSHTYVQAPYEEITEEEYNKLVAEMPDVNFDDYREVEDNTTGSQELACKGGACEIV